MYQITLLLAFLGGIHAYNIPFNYCTIATTNTLCRFSVNAYGPACAQLLVLNITETDKKNIVAMHNSARRYVAKGLETRGRNGPQPPASNMRELAWDDELAAMAQAWANQCTFQHDPNRNVARFVVGQNIYTSFSSAFSTSVNWGAAINATTSSWYSEVDNMDTAYVTTFTGTPAYGVIGHYTAVVWADTSRVGCGVIGFYNSAQPSYPYQKINVCNYGEAGNWISSPIYQTGPAGSACPVGTYNKDGLCAEKRKV